jgi:hypothetical protein
MSNDETQMLDAPSLHQEFWTLTAILTVVTSMNNTGTAKLRTPDASQGPIYNGLLDNPTSGNPHVVLNALAALMVRDTEVIAVVPYRRSPVEETQVAEGAPSSGVAEGAPPSPENAEYQLEVLAFQEGFDDWHAIQFEDNFERFAAFNNTDTKDRHFIDANDLNRVTLVKGGQSLWEQIKKDPWFARSVVRY